MPREVTLCSTTERGRIGDEFLPVGLAHHTPASGMADADNDIPLLFCLPVPGAHRASNSAKVVGRSDWGKSGCNGCRQETMFYNQMCFCFPAAPSPVTIESDRYPPGQGIRQGAGAAGRLKGFLAHADS